MAITSTEIRITLRYTYLAQKCENVQVFEPQGAAFLTADMPGVLEAYWNDIKAAMRALTSTSLAVGTFDSIIGESLNGDLQLAEYAIPPGERIGTRAAGDDGQWLTSLAAVGCRQTVATRFTRPGQKRFPWLREGDVEGNELTPTFISLVEPAFDKFCTALVLGAPVALGALQPIIVHEPGVRDPVRRTQYVTGKVVNQSVTSQVSRKKGRGA